MSSARRYLLSRPRTKLYDYNYSLGEQYYRPMVDSLDQRKIDRNAAKEPATSSAPISSGGPSTHRRSVDESSDYGDDSGASATLRRIRASRLAMEEETRAMEEASSTRRAMSSARGRLDVSDRLLDSVGLKSNGYSEESISRRQPRRAISELEDDSFFKKRTFAIKDSSEDDDATMTRWTKVGSSSRRSGAAMNGHSDIDADFDTSAALARAKKSRARIAEIDNEMEELAERSRARGMRRANAAAVLAEAADMDEGSSSVKQTSSAVRVKRTTVTEKRSVAY